MRKNKHAVALSDEQRAALEDRFAGPLTLRQRNRVQVLLRADAGEPDADIADELGISTGTVANVRKRFVADGLAAAQGGRRRVHLPNGGRARAVRRAA